MFITTVESIDLEPSFVCCINLGFKHPITKYSRPFSYILLIENKLHSIYTMLNRYKKKKNSTQC